MSTITTEDGQQAVLVSSPVFKPDRNISGSDMDSAQGRAYFLSPTEKDVKDVYLVAPAIGTQMETRLLGWSAQDVLFLKKVDQSNAPQIAEEILRALAAGKSQIPSTLDWALANLSAQTRQNPDLRDAIAQAENAVKDPAYVAERDSSIRKLALAGLYWPKDRYTDGITQSL